MLPFHPPVSVRTYVSWQSTRSQVVDAFVEYLRSLS
jgi:hypothetical protein